LRGVLIAIGRAAPFGEAHALVTRYVSFSSLFWLGWVRLIGMRVAGGAPRIAHSGLALVALLATANALHMMKKAYEVGTHASAIETTIRTSYPHVDRAVLGEIYFDEPDVAMARLETLHTLGFPPFYKRDVETAR
jgi:hypothetical protein